MSEPSLEQVDAAMRAVLGASGQPARVLGREPVRFEGRLLAYRHVEALAPGLNEILLAPGTVITPLAHDHLKRLGITPRIAAAGQDFHGGARGEWGLAIDDDSGPVQALARSLMSGPERWVEVGPDVLSTARWVALGTSRGAVLLTPEGAVAAWAANQVPGLRAATVQDPEAAARAARSLGMNLLVLEPAGKSIAWLRQIVQTFRRAGAPRPPAWLNGGEARHEDRRGVRARDTLSQPPQPEERPVRAGPAHAARGPDGWLARAR